MSERTIKKVLVANRGEIAIRVFRACTELGVGTVAIYSKEDELSYHRYKADEAYIVGEGKKPIEAYLDYENIIHIAKQNGVDAIHPGYGFLSENIHFARRCEEEGIIFIGPHSKHLDVFGDKVKARTQAILAGIPVIPGTDGPVQGLEEIQQFVSEHGFPIIIKAALGGGGRGMRIVREQKELNEAFQRAQSEAKAAFGSGDVYVEKLVERPKHIEVQILGDKQGNIVHLFERDCSIQRRHQKVVEIAPSVSIGEQLRTDLCDAAVQLMKSVDYYNAGTVEFLVANNQFYFIEVNPRVQVEHTITEMITGVDIVQSQILLAEGHSLHSEEVGIPSQEEIYHHGYAIQSRVTTEDPLNGFLPDTGKITAYRSGGGFGVRLDTGNSFQGAIITPYYDSLLVKVTTWGLTFKAAAAKMDRNLREFRIRGIKTNIPFLENVVRHEKFLVGDYDTSFIDQTPALFEFTKRQDRATKILNYIGNVTVNGFPGIGSVKKPYFETPPVPKFEATSTPIRGTKQILDEEGVEGLKKWILERNEVLLTDTTFRDAHQSLLATRIRTKDLLPITAPTAHLLPDLFSMEMWGGATFDVAYRFLKENPWERLKLMREQAPNVLFQMLLRSANGVGYKNYPDNLIEEFIAHSAQSGIDVFRIFDSLNWVDSMAPAIRAVKDSGKVAEAAICYTGDVLDKTRTKYDLAYYKNLSLELEKLGADIIAIKDMAGLLKPEAAYQLVSTLKEHVSVPIHLHTHDTSGNGVYQYARAIEAGVDIVDVAASSMAGLTSQPSASTLWYALQGNDRQPNVKIDHLEQISHYWEGVRQYYAPFESGMKSPHTEVYVHEMPGGQYSNLQQQAKGVALEHRWDEVKTMYGRVNHLFGDIVKVTPSSKVVGDMALFMVQNDLTEHDVIEKGMSLDFPDSVIEFFSGYLGQPVGGFPKELQNVVLKGKKAIEVRPGELLEPVNFDEIGKELRELLNRPATKEEELAYALYPKVFKDYVTTIKEFGNVSILDTPTFLHGLRLGESVSFNIERGKTLIVKLVSISEPRLDGYRTLYFELNGQSREVQIKDESIQSLVVTKEKADRTNPNHLGATMPGTVVKVLCEVGERVQQGEHLLITESMKMETTVQAPFTGRVKAVNVRAGEQIQTGDLLITIEK